MSTKPTVSKPPSGGKQSAVANAGANKLANAVAAAQKADNAPDAKDDAATSKKQAMDDAVNRFQEISKKLGGASQAQAFFATYGTDGFKPEAEEKPEPIVPKEITLDSEIKDREGKGLGLPTRPEGFGASYIKEDPWAVEEINDVKVATQLKEKEWKQLLETTKMLHGFVISNAPGMAGTVSRARFPAFTLKPLPGKALSEALTSKPHFEVFDNSSITVKETKTQLEKSMAQNGFSSAAIEASVGASTPTIGASVSGSHKQESEQSKNRGDFADRQEYTATYNFPRARVFVDELNLQVTPECATYLLRLREANRRIHFNVESGDDPDKDNAVDDANKLVRQFFQRFGHIFATTFQLGGQLTATKSAQSIASTSEESKRDAMQQAAAVSVGFKVFSASTSVSRGSSQEDKAAASALANNSALAWSARGGNTLLCANPPEWANSVANYETWRVIEQENVEVLFELIGKLTSVNDDTLAEWADIPTIFNDIAQREFQVQPDIPPGTWTGKMTLETLNGSKVILDKDGQLRLSSENNAQAAVLTVLDADMKRSSEVAPSMAQLYADHPLFLVTGKSHARKIELGSQIPGLWVDASSGSADGTIKSESNSGRKICRWSLRPGSTTFGQALNPDQITIRDGDQVTLSCHSYHSGGTFTDTNTPPFYSPSVARRDNELKVFKLDETFVKNLMSKELCDKLPSVGFLRNGTNDVSLQGLIEQSDVGRLTGSGASQLEFYRKFLATKDLLNNQTEDLQAMVAPLDTQEWWTSDPLRTARILTEKPITAQTKKVDLWQFLVEREVRTYVNKWVAETGFSTDPVVFRVKFVN